MSKSVSSEGLALVKRFEGFRAEPLTLADGRVLVGYGHVQAMAPAEAMTEARAEALLKQDLGAVEVVIDARVLAPLTQQQFDALASFVFSIGAEAFVKSDVLRRLNAGEPIAAACAMDAWRKSRVNGEPQVLDALVRRRAAERAHFLALDEAVTAPSAYVRAELDHAASILGAAKVAAMPETVKATVASSAAAAHISVDDETKRLADILARDPSTAHALMPPPAPEMEDEEPLLLDRVVQGPVNSSNDITGLALFGLGGAGLFAGGLVALNQGNNVFFLLLTAPGAVMMLAAGWQLLKDRITMRWPGDAVRG